MKLESKIGTIKSTDEKVYNFLTDFDNFKNLIPEDKISNWENHTDHCKFTVDGVGEVGVKILEKEPYKLIKLTEIDNSRFNFFFWVQLKQVAENDTKIKLTLQTELNIVLQTMAKKPLQQFLDTLVDQIGKMSF